MSCFCSAATEEGRGMPTIFLVSGADVVEEEVVQFIGSDDRFGGLDLPIGTGRDQFGGDLGVEHRLQHVFGGLGQGGS